jgi:hypothetical protein
MLTYALLLLLGLLGGVIAVASLRPEAFRVSRSAIVGAPASAVFEEIADFRKWESWSPWAKLDPNVKNSFDGSPGAVGSSFEWSGNSKVGAGKMTLLECVKEEMLRIRLNFERPMKAENLVTFALSAAGESTKVTWSMSGKNNFIAKLFGLFMNVEKMCGNDFEKGLANLKTLLEERP